MGRFIIVAAASSKCPFFAKQWAHRTRLSVCHSLSLPVSDSLSVTLCRSLSVSLSRSLSLSLPLSLPVRLSVCLPAYLPVFIYLSIYPSLRSRARRFRSDSIRLRIVQTKIQGSTRYSLDGRSSPDRRVWHSTPCDFRYKLAHTNTHTHKGRVLHSIYDTTHTSTLRPPLRKTI